MASSPPYPNPCQPAHCKTMAWPCKSVAAPWGGHDGKKPQWTPLQGKVVSGIVAVIQSLSSVWLSVTPWTAAHQTSLSSTIARCLLRFYWISDAIQPSHLLSSPSPPTSGSFQMSQFFASGGQRIGVSPSASVLPMNIQDWFQSGGTGWISLQSKSLSRVFSNATVQKHQFFRAQLSFFIFKLIYFS